MKKQEIIDQYLKEPVRVGDSVYVRGLGSQNKNAFTGVTKVIALGENDSVVIEEYSCEKEVKKEDWRKYTDHLGYSPPSSQNLGTLN